MGESGRLQQGDVLLPDVAGEAEEEAIGAALADEAVEVGGVERPIRRTSASAHRGAGGVARRRPTSSPMELAALRTGPARTRRRRAPGACCSPGRRRRCRPGLADDEALPGELEERPPGGGDADAVALADLGLDGTRLRPRGRRADARGQVRARLPGGAPEPVLMRRRERSVSVIWCRGTRFGDPVHLVCPCGVHWRRC